MRRLAQPEVLKSSAIAALLTALACYPRLLLWTDRRWPTWYLEAVLFLGGIVLWAFVFAWHTEYTKRPVFTLKLAPALLAVTTLAGIATAAALYFFLDPILRQRTPEAYPANLEQWIAKSSFSLAFLQLFLVFAPFAWLMRLLKRPRVAAGLTVLLGVAMLALQTESSPLPVPLTLFARQLLARITIGSLSVWFYWRGGILLTSWWAFLLESRHLPGLMKAL